MLRARWQLIAQQHQDALLEERRINNALSQGYQQEISHHLKAKQTDAEVSLLDDQRFIERNRLAIELDKRLEDEK